MTGQKLDQQIGSMLAVYYVTLGAADKLGQKAELLLLQDGQRFSHEAKRRMNIMRQSMSRIKYCLDFFYENVLDSLVTDEGKTDLKSTVTSFLKDANQIARTVCEMYNSKVKSGKIDQEIINYFNVREYENKGTDSTGDSSPK